MHSVSVQIRGISEYVGVGRFPLYFAAAGIKRCRDYILVFVMLNFRSTARLTLELQESVYSAYMSNFTDKNEVFQSEEMEEKLIQLIDWILLLFY